MRIVKSIAIMAIMAISASCNSQAQSLKDIISGAGSTISNMVEGVFAKTNLKIEDLTGDWKGNGPAVCFQDDNFLKKAGGIATAAAVEAKLEPYYKQYGLNNPELIVDKDGNFTLKIKKLSMSGTITAHENEKGVFDFHFRVAGMNVFSTKTYIQKTGKNMDVMFEADKLKSFVSLVAKYSGSTMAKAFGSILDSYDGMCVGFKLTQQATTQSSTSKTTSQSSSSSSGSTISEGLNSLKNMLGTKKK